MLTQLHIQGLAIIDALSIEFSSGFNVITGETGAGKSILIKALGLLLGTKASAETVRHGRESATVSGAFDAPRGHACAEVLRKYTIPFELDGDEFSVLVRRSITSKGRSLAWINDVPVTIAVLREFGASLIDIFGQHENQRLLDVGQHTAYLDQFLSDRQVLVAYREAFEKTQEIVGSLAAMVEDFRAKSRDADYLTYRHEELSKFAPDRADFERVQALCRRSGDQLAVVKALETSQQLVEQGAGGEALSNPLWEIARLLSKIETLAPELKPLADEAATVAARLDDLSFELGKSLSSREVDESTLEEAQARLARYQELFRKLAAVGIDELVAEKERLEGELAFLESAAQSVVALLDQLAAAATTLAAKAKTLTAARVKARQTVRQRIERELHELAMPGARLEVELTEAVRGLPALGLAPFGPRAEELWLHSTETLASLTEVGAEKAQFLLATNPGEPLHPLHKTASGGEVSRMMLALKKGLADGADTCILVFDEIDTGISGRVADIVGRKMQDLSRSFQVICISHLAQVAAYADTHFLVHKFGKEKRTESTITRLTSSQSAEEIARLLSGSEVTPSSLANARALVAKARATNQKDGPPAAATGGPKPKVSRKDTGRTRSRAEL